VYYAAERNVKRNIINGKHVESHKQSRTDNADMLQYVKPLMTRSATVSISGPNYVGGW